MDNLGLYVHIPFCKRKCIYCDFTSFCNKDNYIEKYIETLKKEIKDSKNKALNNKISTIYIGGGTPSYIDSKYIVEILDVIKENFNICEDCVETTIEVNPGTIEAKEKLQNYLQAGINRLSIGLQATDNDLLQTIGRIHKYEDFLNTYNLAREVGFKNINVDLMLGLPNQTLEMLQESVSKIIELEPEHISIYSLIVEEDTPIKEKIDKGILKLPDEDLERKMYWKVKTMLETAGYVHYEISNFAKKNYESKHNKSCWEQEEYIGFGLAAHSYFNGQRYSNTENLEQYIEDFNKKTINEIQTEESKEKEYMLLRIKKNRRSKNIKV